METKEHSKEVVVLNKKIVDLEGRFKQEVENNVALEQYTRRKSLQVKSTPVTYIFKNYSQILQSTPTRV